MIDPTIKSSLDTYVSSANPTAAYGSFDQLRVGHASWMGYARSLMWFDVSALKDTDVSTATLSAYCISKGASNYYTNLATATAAWGESTTWNTKPSIRYLGANTVSAADTWLDFGVTAAVKAQTRTSSPDTNYGFCLYQPEDGTRDTSYWRYFASSEYTDSSKRPKLVVDYNAAPAAVTSLSATTEGLDWWRASSATAPADIARAGRGNVTLSWARPARAQGYRIGVFDGNTTRTVATIPDARTTTWNSSDAQIYPSDTEISKLPTNTAANPFTRAITPADATKDASVVVTGAASTAIVLTDGTYLYTRASSAYSTSPDAWTRTGNGIVSTATAVQIGASGPTAKSGFYLDGVLYNGYATSANTIEGVWKNASATSTKTVTLTFSKPLLKAWSGTELPSASGDVLLACDGQYIYSCASSLSGGGTNDGYRVRVYDLSGTWVADHDVPVTLNASTGGIFCDDGALYFMEWANANATSIDKVSTNSFKLLDRHSITQSANVLGGCYDEANDRFFLGQKSGSTVTRYLGPGLDLRDDANALYKKTNGTAYDNRINYSFVVVPYNDYSTGSNPATTTCAAVTPTLPDRSVTSVDDPRHTTEDLGSAAGDAATALLDTGELELSATDLTLASYGPQAGVSRTYRSDNASSASLGTGWRFDFEQSIVASGTSRTWIDDAGDAHVFSLEPTSGVYLAPPGLVASLSVGATTTITFKDRTTLAFDGSGRLASETDRNGDKVTYSASGEDLVITAANGRSLTVDRDVTGRVMSVSDGTRTIDYVNDGDVKVTKYAGTLASSAVTYAYANSRIASVSIADFPTSGQVSSTSFLYSGADLSEVRYPAWPSDADARATITYGTRTATISRTADVSGTADVSVTNSYTWNPNGTTATRTEPHVAGETLATWTYEYAPSSDLVCEISPTGAEKTSVVDATGNLLYDYDEDGHRSAYAYNSAGDCIRETDPRGATTWRTFDASGNVTHEERSLSESERAVTDYVIGAHGLVSSQTQSVSATASVTTEFTYDPSGQVATTTLKDVELSLGATPVDITTTSVYDAYGHVVRTLDASGSLETSTTYDIAGRATISQDRAGVLTHTTYDKMGDATESWRSAEGTSTKADWSTTAYDAAGRVSAEKRLLSNGTVVSTTTHAYDSSGREIETDSSTVGNSPAHTHYDARGNVVASWAEGVSDYDTAHGTFTGYDAYSRETTTYAPGTTNIASLKTYYPGGELKSETLANGTYSKFTYDDGGNQVAVTKPSDDGTEVTETTDYDLGGRLIAATDENGVVTTHAYDHLGREIIAQGEGSPSTIVYNAAGNVIAKVDADGIKTLTVYDRCGRTLSESTVVGTTSKTTTTGYDDFGRVASITDPDGRVTGNAYDEFGRAVEVTQTTANGVVKHETATYDSLGRVTDSLESVSGVSKSYTYPVDTAGQTTVAETHGGITTTLTLASTSDSSTATSAWDGGSLTRTAATSGTDAAGRATAWSIEGLSYSRTYDASKGHLTGYSAPALTATIGYNDAGKKGSETITASLGVSVSRTYTYTDDSRLDRVTGSGEPTATFSFDGAGNLTAETSGATSVVMSYTTDSQRLKSRSVGGSVVTTYTFDVLGRRIYQGPTGNPTAEQFGYTGTGRMSSYISSSCVASYTFDATGQRKTSVVSSGSLTTTTTYSHEGLNLLGLTASRSDGATWSVTYLFDAEGRAYAGVYRRGATSTPFLLQATDRGDVVALTDTAGRAFAAWRYDVWGVITGASTASTGSVTATLAADIAARQPLRYAGYVYDSETSMYYCSARTYDPVTRQFMGKDPARADGEESAYQYCAGDPVGRTDASGLSWEPAKAVQYARKWVNSFNPVYPNYSASGDDWGGDCTNFVSQCLAAGGMGGDHDGTWTWWCPKKGTGTKNTVSWSVAQGLYLYLTKGKGFSVKKFTPTTADSAATPPDYSDGLRLGDVICYDFAGDGRVDHSAIVTSANSDSTDGYRGGTVAYHSKPRLDVVWNLRPHWGEFPNMAVYRISVR